MPELPEIETVYRGLLPLLRDRTIQKVILHRAGLRFPFPSGFAAGLEGRRIAGIDRRGKYLLFRLDDGGVWVSHLGMSGRFLFHTAAVFDGAPPGARHEHVRIIMSGDACLSFHDPRRFGAMDLVAPGATHPSLDRMGPEPLDPAFNGPALALALHGRRAALKAVLLDQGIVAGIGNIYACEALWWAGLDPRQAAGALGDTDAARLTTVLKTVLHAAIAAGGSSLRDHRQINGDAGHFQHQWRAYGQAGAPCRHAGCTGTIHRIVQGGRPTFYCPEHQRS